MSALRKVNRLNDLLRRELGERKWRHGWQHSRSEALKHPMEVLDSDGKPVCDYICPCGKNRRENEHAENCSQIVRPVSRLTWAWFFPNDPDAWAFCRRFNVNREEFVATYQSESHYRPQVWQPVTFDSIPPPGYLIVRQSPTEQLTEMVIRTIKAFESRSTKDWKDLHDQVADERTAEHYANVREAIREDLGIRPNPGVNSGDNSFPTPKKLQYRGVSNGNSPSS